MFKRKKEIDYEQMFHDSQEKLSWLMDALETKQIQCDIIENVAENLRKENKSLKETIASMERGMLNLPKLLGKNLGK